MISTRSSLFVLAAVACAARIANAEVNSFGAFNTSVSVDVPAFHELEPSVGLQYNSQAGNSVVGVGWRMSPGSTIVRGSQGGGTPAFAVSDVYSLDGQELVPCSAESRSPSCVSAVLAFGSSGAFYSTIVDNLERISFDPLQDEWTIWARNGTKSVYRAQPFADQLGTYRWALTTVTDVHLNLVTYSYFCDSVADQGVTLPRECYLDKIRYVVPRTFLLGSAEGAVVKFHYEGRDDVQTYGTGHMLAIMRKRLKTIEVRFAGQTIRADTLSYVYSSATGASELVSIQQFGRDAIVDELGGVSQGLTPPLPPRTFRTSSVYPSSETWQSLAWNLTGPSVRWAHGVVAVPT